MENTNNIEVEAKILDVSHKDLETEILELGGEKIFDGELDAIWFQNLEGIRVRVRKEGEKIMTEYKKLIGDDEKFKKSLEVGYETDNLEKQIDFFEALGYKQISRSIKRRVSYLIENNDNFGKVQLDFDEYSDLDGMQIPELLEIEAGSGEIILNVAEILGFTEKDLKNWNSRKLSEYYSKHM